MSQVLREAYSFLHPLQIAKTLDLDPPQRAAMVSLWSSFEARMARVLDTRVSLHQRISGTMPNGYMGRDFAVNFFKARPRTPQCFHPSALQPGLQRHAWQHILAPAPRRYCVDPEAHEAMYAL